MPMSAHLARNSCRDTHAVAIGVTNFAVPRPWHVLDGCAELGCNCVDIADPQIDQAWPRRITLVLREVDLAPVPLDPDESGEVSLKLVPEALDEPQAPPPRQSVVRVSYRQYRYDGGHESNAIERPVSWHSFRSPDGKARKTAHAAKRAS